MAFISSNEILKYIIPVSLHAGVNSVMHLIQLIIQRYEITISV